MKNFSPKLLLFSFLFLLLVTTTQTGFSSVNAATAATIEIKCYDKEKHLSRIKDILQQTNKPTCNGRSKEYSNTYLVGSFEQISQALNEKNSCTFVALLDQLPVGFIHIRPLPNHPKTYEIPWLAVDTQYQKKGIAKKLIEQVKQFAQENNIAEIHFHTLTSNTIAQQLYTKCGDVYQALGTLRQKQKNILINYIFKTAPSSISSTQKPTSSLPAALTKSSQNQPPQTSRYQILHTYRYPIAFGILALLGGAAWYSGAHKQVVKLLSLT